MLARYCCSIELFKPQLRDSGIEVFGELHANCTQILFSEPFGLLVSVRNCVSYRKSESYSRSRKDFAKGHAGNRVAFFVRADYQKP